MTANQKKDGANPVGGVGGTSKKTKGRPRKPKTDIGDSIE